MSLCDFKADYRSALLDFLTTKCERSLGHAYEMGRCALADGMGILEVIEIHNEAFADHMSRLDAPATIANAWDSARRFLLEVLAAFEMVNRGFRDANTVLRHFNEALEAEMKRVAHLLHDDTGQLIAAMHLELDMAGNTADAHVGRRLDVMRRLLMQIDEQVRRISREMHPPVLDNLGLVPAFEFLRGGLEQRSKLRVRVEGPQDLRFPEAIEMTVYRVVQEALTNVVKHAKATSVTIRLESTSEGLRCSVQDDGIGFDVKSQQSEHGDRGMGLLAMKHRLQRVGGELHLHSAPGHGTEVSLTIRP